MNAPENIAQTYGIAAAVCGLLLIFLPIIIAISKGRAALVIAAAVFSVLSLVGFGLAAASGIGAVMILPGVGMTWLAGLLCGLAAFLDSASERRMSELQYRLLTNDPRHMPQPPILKAADRWERKTNG